MKCMGNAKRIVTRRCLFTCILCTCLVTIYVGLYPFQDSCNCQRTNQDKEPNDVDDTDKDKLHTLALIIPLRDRFEELLEFASYMDRYLNEQHVQHKVFVINQVDVYRFNRAALINVGYLESKGECDYLAMHDVDLLPLNPDLNYGYPANGPFHIAAPNLHPRYHYPKFVGGILLLTYEDFEKTRGLSNKYWGWGQEDDEFYVRMNTAGLKISRPVNITTGYKTFRHIHDPKKRPRDNKRYFNQRKVTSHRDYETGFHTLSYEIVARYNMVIDGAPLTVLNVQLHCNYSKTPWCLREENQHKAKPFL